MSDYLKILLSNRAEPSQAREPEPSQAREPEPSQSRAKSVLIAESRARAKSQAKSQVKRQGNITLYHYSQADIKGYIDPAFFGLNNYSGHSKRLSQVKRSYFYLEPIPFERQLEGCKYLYISEIKENKIYNIMKDPLKLLNKYKTVDGFFRKIKSLGYIGLLGHTTYKFEVISLFKRIKIKQKEVIR